MLLGFPRGCQVISILIEGQNVYMQVFIGITYLSLREIVGCEAKREMWKKQKCQFRKEEERSERQMPRTEIMTEAQDRPLEVSQPKECLTHLFFFFISTPLSYSPSQCTCFAPKGKDKPEERSPGYAD